DRPIIGGDEIEAALLAPKRAAEGECRQGKSGPADHIADAFDEEDVAEPRICDVCRRNLQPALEHEERIAISRRPERAPGAAMTQVEIMKRVAIGQRETPRAIKRLPELGAARHQVFA